MIGIVLGSPSDKKIADKGIAILEELDIPHKLFILSAHRTPDLLEKAINENGDIKVWIGFAGLAAHLCGVIASHTTKPVIGVPVASGALAGMDSLLAMVQMPSGIPVGVVGINNAKNGMLLACQILGIEDSSISEKIKNQRLESRKKYG
ncbi:5-(carboxyamino)imidazole ribonucleotide mutase [bacterium]|nr:5-(carboxyamino)imidazole ribonucleotide mutase [bacterium]MBD61742.1 5-(carboxyamino)imidazole ribonucleotide mutase [bacterium]|tara:strand:- start:1838 stop:2284 length:447 start_codon:yes stop_codon:yes gene_type:complete